MGDNVVPFSGAPPSGDDAIIIDPKAPLETARLMVKNHFAVSGTRTIQHQQGTFHHWINTHYAEILNEEMRCKIYEFLDTASVWVPSKKDKGKFELKGFKPTARSVSDVLDAFRAAAQLSNEVRQPAWILEKHRHGPASSEIISCQNGLLHLPSGEILSHTPAFYSNTSLEYHFNASAPEPVKWLEFLKSIWPHDNDARSTLQDVFGYLLGTDTDQQKIPLLVGPKRSGKGTIGRILTAMVGQTAVVSPTLASLESNFGLSPLIGKRIAIISDARLGGRSDQQAIAERLLSISGEDMQTVDRKHIAAWSGKLPTRFFIMSNELPRIADASGALASRFLVLTMQNSFYGSEDHGLTPALLQELPGILNWAIAGWRNIRTRGYFLPPASSLDAIREIEDLSSPIGAFLRERCLVGPGKDVSVDGLYLEWEDWCNDQGRDHIGTKQNFGRDLKSAVPGLKKSQPRVGDNERERRYNGLCLKPNQKNEEKISPDLI